MSDNELIISSDDETLETTFSSAEKKKKRHRRRKNSNKKFEIGNMENLSTLQSKENPLVVGSLPLWWIEEPLNDSEDEYENDMVVKVSLTRQVEREEIKMILPGGTLRMGKSRVKLTNYKPTERRLYLEFTHLMWLYINEDLEITTFSSYLSGQVFVLFRLGLQMTNGMRDTNVVENGIDKEFTVLSINDNKAQKINDVSRIKDYMNTIEPHQVVVESNKFGIIKYPKTKDFYEVLKNIQPTIDLNRCIQNVIEKN